MMVIQVKMLAWLKYVMNVWKLSTLVKMLLLKDSKWKLDRKLANRQT